MNLHKTLKYSFLLFGVVVFLFLTACGSENEFETLGEWVSSRQKQQLPGSELIEKVSTDDGYFAVFRNGTNVVLIQRVLTGESKIGGYSSSLSVDDSDGINSNVVNSKTNIESSQFYNLEGRIYKEKTLSLDIDKAYEGKLHISYRWRPIILKKETESRVAGSSGADSSAIDPLVIDVETFWIRDLSDF